MNTISACEPYRLSTPFGPTISRRSKLFVPAGLMSGLHYEHDIIGETDAVFDSLKERLKLWPRLAMW
jgi:hypothetical protein